MSPNLFGNTATVFLEASQQGLHQEKPTKPRIASESTTGPSPYKWQIVWRNVIAFLYLHSVMVYTVYLMFTSVKLSTTLFQLVLGCLAAMGITAGAHRLWAHRSYKAKWPLRLILMILQTVAFQNHIYEWVRDHRVHHKFTDTDADPHNSRRGFFFSHMGWLMVRKHPDVKIKGALVDMSDLEKDPIVIWQRRLYLLIMPLCTFIIPTWVPYYFWGETLYNSSCVTIFRYTLSLNMTWLVNSAAHIWGMKPYDKSISPTDNIKVAWGAFGEGWHNYHHVFPWDYKAAELGDYNGNLSTAFIDFFAKIGWAYDLKTVPVEMVRKRAARTGDGTRTENTGEDDHSHEEAIWGWGDADMEPEEMKLATILNKAD